MKIKIILASAFLLWIAIFIFSVDRDLLLVKLDGFGDLRNRVVGARLIKDGQSPYWHKWEAKDGTRYYDKWNISPYKLTNITASPFFLHLMEPFADNSQKKLSQYWLFIEYLTWFLIVLMAFLLPEVNSMKKRVLLVPALLFMLTVPWVHHIKNGQNYIFIPLLLMAFYFVFNSNNRYFIRGICCGILAIALILIKPILILFFVPYLFSLRMMKRSFVVAAIIPFFIVAAWLLTDQKEQLYWKDYIASVSEHVKYHQKLGAASKEIEIPPVYTEVEGIDLQKSKALWPELEKRGIVLHFQTASVYVNFSGVFHRAMPVFWLNMIATIICVLLMSACWWRKKQSAVTFSDAALMGFCLYFIADIFAPVYRGEYAAMAWLFPVAVLPSLYKSHLRYPYLLFFTGFAMNIFYFKIDKIQYAIGEYMMLLALLFIVFWRKPLHAGEEMENNIPGRQS